MFFKVISGYECGSAEDGMMCKSYTGVIEADTAEEAEELEREMNKYDSDFIGCHAEEMTEEEIKEYLELEKYYLDFLREYEPIYEELQEKEQ